MVLLGSLAAACSENDGDVDAAESGGRLSIVASTTIVADLVEQVGGDRVSVSSAVPANADAHTLALTPSDLRRIGEADLIVVVGSDLGRFEDTLADGASGSVLVLTEGMALRPFPAALAHDEHAQDDEDEHGHEDDEGHDHEDEDEHGHEDGLEDEDEDGHDHGSLDPHFWMDVDLTIEAVERIRDELSRLDPGNASTYGERARAYRAELREVDDEIAETLSALPPAQRYLVTFHDAFGYFAERYGLMILGFVVEGPEEEPSAAGIADLVEAIRDFDVPYIFIEPQFNARVVEQVAAEAGATVRTIPSGSLSDEYPTYVEFLRRIASGIAE